MAELRNILRRATTDSLVITDEMCSTTEHVSAVAIVAEGIATLTRRGACFVMASHLHEVVDTEAFRALAEAVTVAHLHVEIESDGTMIFDRGLRPGKGTALYGLEVARALGLGDEFMSGADAVRRELMGVSTHLVSPKHSRYNPNVYVDKCFMCGAVAEEIHHLRKQADADAAGFFDSTGGHGAHHKNARYNLVAVCAVCHDKQHTSQVNTAVVKTTRGKRIVQK